MNIVRSNIASDENKKNGDAICWNFCGNAYFAKVKISKLKELEGDNPSISFSFQGKILVKIGIKQAGRSLFLVQEQNFSSSEWSAAKIVLDLNQYINGDVEISVLPLDDGSLLPETSLDALPLEASEHFAENELYSFVSPSLELCSEESLYYRYTGNSYYSFEDSSVHLPKNSTVDCLTYFNSFSAYKWYKYTNVTTLSAYIDFVGKAELFVVHKDEGRENILCNFTVDAAERSIFELPIGKYPGTGIIGIRLKAQGQSILYGGGWLSSDPDTQPVHLGIGITTFRRENAVKAAVARLRREISSHPVYSQAIDITVVDNGNTLSPEDVTGALLLPNRNFGGTGGFMRSLIHYKDTGKYTHCLFMDDDACCEASSLFRSVSFMRHAKEFSVAIAGAMLDVNKPYQQWENGAWFDGGCHSVNRNYDLRKSDILVLNEKEDEKKQLYGAWWFFFFPLKAVEILSFPFFVRGDDVEFSYQNKFRTVFINGICAWQEDFTTKENPMTSYLDMRSHIIHHFVLKQIDHGPIQILTMVLRFFCRALFSYEYDTAKVIALAFADVMSGPQYWLANMDMSEIRKKITREIKVETPRTLRKNYLDIPEADEDLHLPFGTKLVRMLTSNGHLLPSCLLRSEVTRLSKFKVPSGSRMFLRDNVLIYNEINNTEILLSRNIKYFLSDIAVMICSILKFIFKYIKIKKDYNKFFNNLKNDKFWKRAFQGERSSE